MADNGDRNDATSQEIWNMLRELTASQRETARLIRELGESGAETDRRMQETDRQMQETDHRLRKLDDQPGRLPAPHLRPQRSARRLIHAPD